MSDDQFTRLSQNIRHLSQTMDCGFRAIEHRFQTIDKKLEAVDQEFGSMEKKFDSRFTKLFMYMERKFGAVDSRFEAMDRRFDSVMGLLDTSAKRMEIYDHERLVLSHKVDRHEKWHEQTAKTIGVKLST